MRMTQNQRGNKEATRGESEVEKKGVYTPKPIYFTCNPTTVPLGVVFRQPQISPKYLAN